MTSRASGGQIERERIITGSRSLSLHKHTVHLPVIMREEEEEEEGGGGGHRSVGQL